MDRLLVFFTPDRQRLAENACSADMVSREEKTTETLGKYPASVKVFAENYFSGGCNLDGFAKSRKTFVLSSRPQGEISEVTRDFSSLRSSKYDIR